jgi:hypothetical protein
MAARHRIDARVDADEDDVEPKAQQVGEGLVGGDLAQVRSPRLIVAGTL